MRNKIELLVLDIDAGAMIKKSAESRQEVERLKDEVKYLQQALKEGDKIIDNTRKRLAELQKQGKGNSDEYKALEKSLDNFTKKQDQNSQKLEIVSSGLRKQQADYRMAKKGVDVYNKTVEDQLGIITKTDGSINQLNQAVANNRKIYRELTAEQRENEAIGGRLLTIITAQDKEYKELQKSIGTTQVEVGNYKEQIKEALSESSSFSTTLDAQIAKIPIIGTSLSVTTKYLRGYAQGQIAAATATSGGVKALKLFRVALISTGIGAILVALGALVSYFTSTQEGINKVNKVLIPLKTIFQSLIGVFQNVGKQMSDAFTNPQESIKKLWESIKTNIINRITGLGDIFKSLGKIISSGFTDGYKDLANATLKVTTGVDDVIGKTKTLAKQAGDFFDEAYKRGQRIAEIQQKLSAGEADFIIKLGESKEQFKEQNKIAEDQTKTLSEREAAARKSIEILENTNKVQRERNNLELELLMLKAKSNDTSDAERAEIANKVVELKEANAAMLEATTTQQNKLNSIVKEGENKRAAARQKAIDNAITKSKEELDLYIAQEGQKAKSLSDTIKLEEDVRDKKLAILKQELKAKKISQTKYETEVINLKRDFLAKQAELTIEHAQKELDIYIAQNQSLIDNQSQLTESLVDEEQKRLQDIYDKRLAILEEQRANELISEQDFLLAKLNLQAEYLQQESDLKEQFNAQEREKKEAQRQADKEIELAQAETDFEEQRVREQQQHEQRLIDLTAHLEQGKITEEQYNKLKEAEDTRHAEAKKALDLAVVQQKVDLANQALSAISAILDKESAAGKAVAIAQSLINTAQGVTKALAEGGIIGIATGAIVAAAGAVSIAKIASTKTPKRDASKVALPKAEKGMQLDIGGKRHSEGGTKFYGDDGTAFEAEKGEKMFVLSRKASAAMAPLLSEINQQHGGVSFTTPSTHLALGGQILRASTGQSINYDLLASKIGNNVAQANASLPTPNVVVAVEDINTGQSNYAQVVNGANL